MSIFGYKKLKQHDGDLFSIQETGKLKLDNYSYRLAWTEDSFSCGGVGREKVGRSFDSIRLPLIGFAMLLFMGVLVARAAYLQVYKGDYYYQMAEGNRIRIERVEAKRGIIYDSSGHALVTNKANFLLYFVPSDLPKDESQKSLIIDRVSQILAEGAGSIVSPVEPEKALTPEDVRAVIGTELAKVKKGSLESYQPLFIADKIQYDKAMLLSLESANWQGVVLSSRSGREYHLPSLSTAHLLGYTGKINEEELGRAGSEYQLIDYLGKSGLEYFWENELKGVSGKKQIEVDALGREKKILSSQKAEDGRSLLLSLDSQAQQKLEELIKVTLEKAKLTKASAIVMNPNNGEIIAMVSLPSYDNNVFARGIKNNEYKALVENDDRPLFSRAVAGAFPSGSTIKPVMSAAALEEGIINERTTILSNGGIRIGQWYFPDWKAGGHGMTDVKKAIAQSVNTFFYYIGGGYQGFTGLGVERIVRYEKMFGLGEQTGVDLPGEAAGFLPTKEWKKEAKSENWYIGDTYHLSIGQGDLTATPLQVALFTSVFANGGTVYRPHLVRALLSNEEKFSRPIEIVPVKENFLKPDTVRIVREGMRQTVTSGSARSLSSLSVTSAGKTGTAQWSSKAAPHAWYTGFAPFEKPEIVVTILIEEGKEGSTIAVPIVKDFYSWYFNRASSTPVAAKP